MRRYIEFRGKRTSDDHWVRGDFMHHHPHHSGATIIQNGCIYNEVHPRTVSEFTGELDLDESQIFEHDILDYWIEGTYVGRDLVRFRRGAFRLGAARYLAGFSKVRVVGNIFDNPELLDPLKVSAYYRSWRVEK